jgi:predicted Zn-dependent protease
MATLIASVAFACATAPKPKPVTRTEIVQHDNAVGTELTGKFEAQIKVQSDREVTLFLRKIAQTLSKSAPDLNGTNVGVLLVRDIKGSWKNFGLPGNRVYVSSALLRSLEFENEAAATIAFELAHIEKRHLMSRVQEAQPALGGTELFSLRMNSPEQTKAIDFVGPNGVFVFTDEAELEAVDAAVELLYQGGYDPRGLLGVWQTYNQNAKHSPYDQAQLTKLLERTRKAITRYAPLRNPIVRTAEFIAIQKRIRKL